MRRGLRTDGSDALAGDWFTKQISRISQVARYSAIVFRLFPLVNQLGTDGAFMYHGAILVVLV